MNESYFYLKCELIENCKSANRRRKICLSLENNKDNYRYNGQKLQLKNTSMFPRRCFIKITFKNRNIFAKVNKYIYVFLNKAEFNFCKKIKECTKEGLMKC